MKNVMNNERMATQFSKVVEMMPRKYTTLKTCIIKGQRSMSRDLTNLKPPMEGCNRETTLRATIVSAIECYLMRHSHNIGVI